MKKLAFPLGIAAIVAILPVVWLALTYRASDRIPLDTPYQAVLLDNGQVYYLNPE